MSIQVRRMQWKDIEQVRALDILCFPTMTPPTNYQTEFVNPLAHYFVAYDNTMQSNNNFETVPLILGFIGLWNLANENHIISLAVCPEFRRKGIGELLLINGLDFSLDNRATLVTLEVRVSNQEAIALYEKYGFTERGVRHAYYLDNREDASIMTLDDLYSIEFRTFFQKLKQKHYESKYSIRQSLPG